MLVHNFSLFLCWLKIIQEKFNKKCQLYIRQIAVFNVYEYIEKDVIYNVQYFQLKLCSLLCDYVIIIRFALDTIIHPHCLCTINNIKLYINILDANHSSFFHLVFIFKCKQNLKQPYILYMIRLQSSDSCKDNSFKVIASSQWKIQSYR